MLLHIADAANENMALIHAGQSMGMHMKASKWKQADKWIEGTGIGNDLMSEFTLGRGDFHVEARLRMQAT